jgi:DNA-binding XRE family transcriptional regulator
MVQPVTSPQPRPSPAAQGRTLSKATLRAANLLGLAQAELAAILGLSRATISRMAAGDHVLAPGQKSWELAALFVRLFRSLDALVGSNEAQARAWLDSENAALAGAPRQLIGKTEGLVRVVQYLDAARGRI